MENKNIDIKQQFITCLHIIVNYYQNESQLKNKYKLNALCHSILTLIDGNNVNFRQFALIPEIENKLLLKNNISGNLADLFMEMEQNNY